MISMISGKVKRKTILQVSRLVQLLVLLPQGLQLQPRLPQVQFHWPMQGPRDCKHRESEGLRQR